MKPARVLHVIDSFDLGGAQEVVLNIAKGADAGRFSHEAATLHGRGVFWDRLAASGIPLHSLSPSKFLPLWAPRLLGLLRSGRFDILHCHLAASNILAKPLGALAGVPVRINHDHTNDALRVDNGIVRGLETWANRFATHCIAVSTTCRDFLIQHESVPAAHVTIVPNGIDTSLHAPDPSRRRAVRAILGLGESDRLVLGVGRLRPQKNFGLFLRVAADIRRDFPGTRFLIAGSGPEETRLRRLSDELGLNEVLRFAGYAPDPRDLYAAADALLMPSRFEGLPMTLLEAMAWELPVVASRLDGIAEVITEGRDGLLVDRDDEAGFARSLSGLLDEEARRAEMGARARQRIVERFSLKRMVSDIESIYTACLR